MSFKSHCKKNKKTSYKLGENICITNITKNLYLEYIVQLFKLKNKKTMPQ